ncbi:MAG: 50S ribosomal protein L30 [Alphaproteobacteria bacterium]|nr:50S ribosomal protein L30 [Alphaproteobacteria bacterium]MDE6570829.1 50S ribosomal protein L30 [Alphaproteobacteria bacterium]
MAKIVVKQTKSIIGRPEAQCKIIKALGLGRIGKSKEITDTPAVRGMIAKVSHLVEVVAE